MIRLTDIIYFTPSLFCIVCFILMLFPRKTITQKMFTWALPLAAFHFFTLAIHILPNTDYTLMSILDIINMPLVTGMLVLLTVMMLYLMEDKRFKWWYTLFTIPAIVQSIAATLLYFILGIDEAAAFWQMRDKSGMFLAPYDTDLHHIFFFFAETSANFVIGAYSLMLITVCTIASRKEGYKIGSAIRLVFRNGSTTGVRALSFNFGMLILCMIPIMIVRSGYLIHSRWLGMWESISVSFFICTLTYIEIFCKSGVKYTLKDFLNTEEMITKNRASIPEEEEIVTTAPAAPRSRAKINHDSLLEKLVYLLEHDKVYRNSKLTLDMLCDLLDTNRNTLSVIIKEHFNLPYRELINFYRIEEAKTYMKEHPKATQETVAFECGFSTASYFNKKFKLVENITPLEWMLKSN